MKGEAGNAQKRPGVFHDLKIHQSRGVFPERPVPEIVVDRRGEPLHQRRIIMRADDRDSEFRGEGVDQFMLERPVPCRGVQMDLPAPRLCNVGVPCADEPSLLVGVGINVRLDRRLAREMERCANLVVTELVHRSDVADFQGGKNPRLVVNIEMRRRIGGAERLPDRRGSRFESELDTEEDCRGELQDRRDDQEPPLPVKPQVLHEAAWIPEAVSRRSVRERKLSREQEERRADRREITEEREMPGQVQAFVVG